MNLLRQHLLCGSLLVFLTCAVRAQTDTPAAWMRIPMDDAEVADIVGRLEGERAAEALAELERLAVAGRGDALFALARARALGTGVPASPAEAERILRRAAEVDQPESLLALGMIAEAEGGDDAIYFYRRAAEVDQPWAMLRLGRCTENGELGLPKNPTRALQFYRRAHEAGLPIATYELGRCYDKGIGVSPDAITSTRLMRQAADAGIVPAQMAMAEAYSEGKGIQRDPVAAVGWLMLAAQRASVEAKTLLGIRYETGDGVVKDLNEAGRLYSAAAQRHDPVALHRLAMLYIEGRGTAKDVVRGYEMVNLARGFPPADKAIVELEATMTEEQLAEARRRIAEDQAGR
jgi:uncharacterized protein